MNSMVREDLMRELAELSREYAPMRFGQLVCFAATLVPGTTPQIPAAVSDQAMLEAIREHRSRLKPRDLSAFGDDTPGLRPIRMELVDLMSKVGNEYRLERLGQLVDLLVGPNHGIYDIADEQLLSIAQQYWEQRGKNTVVITTGGGGDETDSMFASEN